MKVYILAVFVLVAAPLLGGCLGIGGGGGTKESYWWDDRNSERMSDTYRLPPTPGKTATTDIHAPAPPPGQVAPDVSGESSAGAMPEG